MKFIDLDEQLRRVRSSVDKRIAAVLDAGNYILGPEVTELENKLANYVGSAHCITVANGTDALVLGLKALGIGSDDIVLVPSFTFFASHPCLFSKR